MIVLDKVLANPNAVSHALGTQVIDFWRKHLKGKTNIYSILRRILDMDAYLMNIINEISRKRDGHIKSLSFIWY